jgi:hypothetical protein
MTMLGHLLGQGEADLVPVEDDPQVLAAQEKLASIKKDQLEAEEQRLRAILGEHHNTATPSANEIAEAQRRLQQRVGTSLLSHAFLPECDEARVLHQAAQAELARCRTEAKARLHAARDRRLRPLREEILAAIPPLAAAIQAWLDLYEDSINKGGERGYEVAADGLRHLRRWLETVQQGET